MRYLSVKQFAEKWDISERTVRNYCTNGRIDGAVLSGKAWQIPENSVRPERINKSENSPKDLLEILKLEKQNKISGGIYHKIQIELTYNSNHIEGSRLSHEQTIYIYETNTIGLENEVLRVDDIIETANHFRCIDMVIDHSNQLISEAFIKKLHLTLKNGTADSRKEWFAVGEYKKFPNEVGGIETALPENVSSKMKKLIFEYNSEKKKTFEDIISFHYEFESIHPFQDGNGRVGRLLLFHECLRNNIVPFIIDEQHKLFYYRGLREWKQEKGYLLDTCRSAQDKFKAYLNYFRIPYISE